MYVMCQLANITKNIRKNMKKLIILISGFMLLAFTCSAEIRAGISLSAGVFDVMAHLRNFQVHTQVEQDLL